jgi:hypothetical protein
MLRISRKQLVVLVVALAIVAIDAELSRANPVDTKGKAIDSRSKPINSKPVVSKSTDTLSDDDDRKDRHRAGKSGKPRDKGKQGGRRRGDGIPSFRSVRRLESLTPVQEAKITHIIREQREQSLPLMERLKELRAERDAENSASGRPKGSRESAEVRMKIHAIKKGAWVKMQGILTKRQMIELEAHHDDESGPPRRNNPDARPTVHDSGKSFSK